MTFFNKKKINDIEKSTKLVTETENVNKIIECQSVELNNEFQNERKSNSPMSIEDPDEPSPSPINPITLKHTLRLASRVSIPNSSKSSAKYFEQYPSPSLMIELGETLNAISVNDISFSPSPIKTHKLSINSVSIKKCVEKQKNLEYDDNKLNSEEKLLLEDAKVIKEFEIQRNSISIQKETENEVNVEYSPTINLKHNIERESGEVNNKNTVESPSSIESNRSFYYSKWMKKNTITNFINRYIPRFLIPAFNAIKKLRIRFANPKRNRDVKRKNKDTRINVQKKNFKKKGKKI